MPVEIIANEQIKAASVRLIDDTTGSGVVKLADAFARAQASGLDLVIIAPGDVPVCRILNLDRWRYERKRHERDAAKRQRDLTIETKEIQLRPVTTDNDIAIKARKARGFLDVGDKVKVVVRFKGRERSHRSEGVRIIDTFLAAIGEHKVDKPVSPDESDLIMILSSLLSKAERVKTKEVKND